MTPSIKGWGGLLISMGGKDYFIEPRQPRHFTNPKEQMLEPLAEDDKANILITFAEEILSTTGILKSSR